MSRCHNFWSHSQSVNDEKNYLKSEQILGSVLHMLHVTIEALILVIFCIVFDQNSELFETRFERMPRLIGVWSAISRCWGYQNTLDRLNIT